MIRSDSHQLQSYETRYEQFYSLTSSASLSTLMQVLDFKFKAIDLDFTLRQNRTEREFETYCPGM